MIMISLDTSTALVLLVALSTSKACFPEEDVFVSTLQWMLPISVPDRYNIGFENDHKTMLMRNERSEVLIKYTCLNSYGHHRYKVMIEDRHQQKKFQCLKFIPLAPNVVRMAESAPNMDLEKLNCEHDPYTERPAVFIGYFDGLPSQPCPLQGGFQMLLRETNHDETDRCADSGWKYNPSLQFECGENKEVVAQFGRYCVPDVLNKAQKMRNRYLAHLECFASWQEADKGNFVLLKMRDMYTTFWCLNYDIVSDEILSVYLTFDGRCTKKPKYTDDSSRHGHLIKYVPNRDPRCSIPRNCNDPKCSESNECPTKCNRCIAEKKKSHCHLQLDTAGRWKTANARHSLVLDVDTSSFALSGEGEFECIGEAERSLPGQVYPVVQYSSSESCMPYHACSQMLSPAPGLVNFFLRPAATSEGNILSCAETYAKFGHVIPIDQEREMTLVDEDKLVNITCNILQRSTYKTHLKDCNLAVEECSGTCKTIEVGRDVATCGNETYARLDDKHVCHSSFQFDDKVTAIVTKSVNTGHFFCWIFTEDDLKIARLSDCNSEGIRILLKWYKNEYRYDPAFALQYNNVVSGSSDGNYASFLMPTVKVIFFSALFGLISMSKRLFLL